MSYQNGVVEDTPKIHINNVRDFISPRTRVAQLVLTHEGHDPIICYVKTTTTQCYFSGERFWFECGSCGRRAGVLFANKQTSYLSCRRCSNLTYRNQRLSHSSRLLMRYFDLDERAATIFDGVQRVQLHYNGQPTRRFKRYLRYRGKAESISSAFLS